MEEEFDGVQFAQYVRRRWSVVVISCVVATLVAGGVSLILPRRYTATASILIEPPAGNDPRGAMAVSSVYLESLKTYERFASSDTAFATALQELGLRQKFAGEGIESIKRSVLKVFRPTSTKIVEISATLGDPNDAQKLAQDVAQQTVALNRKLDSQAENDLLAQEQKAFDASAARLSKAEQTREDVTKNEGLDVLQNEVADANQLRLSVEEELGKTRALLADTEAEVKTFHDGDVPDAQTLATRHETDALQARVASLEAQSVELAKTSTDAATVLEGRKQRREALDAELRSARADYEVAKTRLSDAQSSSAYRGERLEIMDPGVVPQSPSSPNIPMNTMIAAFISVVGSIGYLAMRFGYSRVRLSARDVAEYGIR